MVIPHRGGLPHSDIHGSKPARGSPWLFAACHVLHRLLVPRHPPNALIALKTTPYTHRNHPHPGDGPILLLYWPPDAIFCASGAHGPLRSAPLRFSKITPCDSAQRSLGPSPYGIWWRPEPARGSSRAHTLSLSRALNSIAAFGSDNPATIRPETHQPLHTDKEHSSDSPEPHPRTRR